jgi:hypothetical protein
MIAAIWSFISQWLALFWAPVMNPDMLWIIVPIYISWIITEIFQEKRDTSFGNAISNGVIVLWVGIDWVRTTVRLFDEGVIATNSAFYAKIALGSMVFMYGLLIMYLGIRANKTVKYIARIREVSYILIMFTPIFYEPELLSVSLVLSIIVFFPVFYLFIEFLDYITPDPKTYDMDSEQTGSLYQPVMKGPPRR